MSSETEALSFPFAPAELDGPGFDQRERPCRTLFVRNVKVPCLHPSSQSQRLRRARDSMGPRRSISESGSRGWARSRHSLTSSPTAASPSSPTFAPSLPSAVALPVRVDSRCPSQYDLRAATLAKDRLNGTDISGRPVRPLRTLSLARPKLTRTARVPDRRPLLVAKGQGASRALRPGQEPGHALHERHQRRPTGHRR